MKATEIIDILRGKNLKIAVAEASTGGALSDAITDVPGAGDVFVEGIICYSNDSKIRLTGISGNILEEHGAVSMEAAEGMASGIRRASCADIGISVTGILGPSGGSDEKPVGTTWIAIDKTGVVTSRFYHFDGERRAVKDASVAAALGFLMEVLNEDISG